MFTLDFSSGADIDSAETVLVALEGFAFRVVLRGNGDTFIGYLSAQREPGDGPHTVRFVLFDEEEDQWTDTVRVVRVDDIQRLSYL